MNYKKRAALLIILIAALCGLAIWGVARFRYRGLGKTAEWLERLPSRDAVVFYIDFAALRKGGVLQMLTGSKAVAEPEYKLFVTKTGFDYERDLDAVLACFTPAGKYFVVKGNFDWSSLESYARDQGGTCRNALCNMNGSTPERKISFFPLRPDLMGLAVSPGDSAASDLETASVLRRPMDLPDAPVWISIPPALLKSGGEMPAGARMFAHSLENTEDVSIALTPLGNRFEARLSVQGRSAQQAVLLAEQLARSTSLLREMIARDKQSSNPRDLSGVLTGGSFQHAGMRVSGSWPLERVFLEGLLAGS